MGKKVVVAGRGMPGKEQELYTLYDDGSILIRDVRGSYVHATLYRGKADPKTGKMPDPKFGIVALLDKVRHERTKRLLDREMGKVRGAANLGELPAANYGVRDGDQAGKKEYKGNWSLNASERENRPPALRDINGGRIDREHVGVAKIDSMFMSGYWYDILVRPWAQKNDYGRKVNFNILALKVNRKDETFGEGGISEDDVDDVFGTGGDTGGFDDDDSSDDL